MTANSVIGTVFSPMTHLLTDWAKRGLSAIPDATIITGHSHDRRDVPRQGHLDHTSAVKQLGKAVVGAVSNAVDLPERCEGGGDGTLRDICGAVVKIDQARTGPLQE